MHYIIGLVEGWAGRHPYVASLVMVGAVTAVGVATVPVLHPANVDMLYLLTVLVSGLTAGPKPAVFSATISAIIFDYYFIPPNDSFRIDDLPYLVTLIVFIVVALATSTLAGRARALTREQAARARAEALNEAKDAILDKVAHELRSPLTAVLGWTQLIERAHAEPERVSRSVSGLQHSAGLLMRLVDDLLNASRITSGKLSVHPAPTMLAPAVSKAVDAMRPLAEQARIRLEANIAPVGEALADEARIGQIVTNLVSNAIKFTPRGGRIVVGLHKTDRMIELTVSDTGAGIRSDFLPRVFDRFSQADEHDARGLGLGLAIVKSLAESHHGSVVAQSAGPNQGSTFIVRLPAVSPRADSPNDRNADSGSRSSSWTPLSHSRVSR